MCDGSLKPIQHVRSREFVLNRSEETGEFGGREVVEPSSNPDRSIIRIELLALTAALRSSKPGLSRPVNVERAASKAM